MFVTFLVFFFLGGGAYLCKLLGGGCAPTPIPTGLIVTVFSFSEVNMCFGAQKDSLHQTVLLRNHIKCLFTPEDRLKV